MARFFYINFFIASFFIQYKHISSIICMHKKSLYQISGENNQEVLLFLHGLGANLQQFENEHIVFSENYKVISINIENIYFLCKQKQENISLSLLAKEIVLVLREKLKIDSCHIVWNSMGWNIAFEIYKFNPSVCKTLTTFGTSWYLQTGKVTLAIVKAMFTLLPMNTIAFLSRYSGSNPHARKVIEDMLQVADKNMLIDMVPVLENFDYLSLLQDIQCPLLIIQWWKDANINKVIPSTLEVLSGNKNFTLKHIPEAGHFVNLDSPEEFHSLLKTFVQKTF